MFFCIYYLLSKKISIFSRKYSFIHNPQSFVVLCTIMFKRHPPPQTYLTCTPINISFRAKSHRKIWTLISLITSTTDPSQNFLFTYPCSTSLSCSASHLPWLINYCILYGVLSPKLFCASASL